MFIKNIDWNAVSDCYNNNWVYKSNLIKWTITPDTESGLDIFYVNNVGSALIYGFRSNTSHQYVFFSLPLSQI